MQDDIRAFRMDLGRNAHARDWAGVRELLAPCLRRSMDADAVRRFFEDEYRLILGDNGIEEMHYREYPDPEVGGNDHTNATALSRRHNSTSITSWKSGWPSSKLATACASVIGARARTEGAARAVPEQGAPAASDQSRVSETSLPLSVNRMSVDGSSDTTDSPAAQTLRARSSMRLRSACVAG